MYQLIETTTMSGQTIRNIKRLSDDSFIPFDPANTDYQAYLKWLDGYEMTPNGWVKTSDGNTPLPADQPEE
jgi:hypothetical protein